MKFSQTAVALGGVLGLTQAAAIKPRNSNSWAGANNYFLQSLTSDEQQSYLADLASSGAKVVRVWVNAQPGQGCQKKVSTTNYADDLETTIGDYNDDTLALLDVALANIQAAGLKAIISPHDGNLVNGHNGDDIYGQTYPDNFYTDSTAASQYDARLSHIVNYVSPSSGMAWKDWTDAIMAFDIQNEPFSASSSCSDGDPAGWMCARAVSLREALGDESPIKITSGGVGADYVNGCNFASYATSCPSIDIIAVHRYADNGWDESGYISDANGKLVYVEEWGISYGTDDQGSEYPSNTDTMNSQGLPWMYWQILPSPTCSTEDSDTFAIYQGGDVDYASAMQSAAGSTAAQDWTGIVY